MLLQYSSIPFLYCHIELHLYVSQTQQSSVIIVILYNLMSSKDVKRKKEKSIYIGFYITFHYHFWFSSFLSVDSIYYTVSFPCSDIASFLLPCFVMLFTKYLYMLLAQLYNFILFCASVFKNHLREDKRINLWQYSHKVPEF